jgi:hypothetical protein
MYSGCGGPKMRNPPLGWGEGKLHSVVASYNVIIAWEMDKEKKDILRQSY